jgi:hypothetical protein
MNLRDATQLRRVDHDAARVYGEPYETADDSAETQGG